MPTGVSNVVVSLMRLVEMLMTDACADPEVEDNRHLRTWLLVAIASISYYVHLFIGPCIKNRRGGMVSAT